MTRAHFGVNLPQQHTSWDRIRDAACLVDRLGYDSLWTWDHFVPLQGDPSGPIFEAWQLLAAWGAVTERVRIGTLVTGVTYRHPAVLASMVATLDHITHGRAMLGLGAAWHEHEHAMYGIAYPSAGGRLARLEEAADGITQLLGQPFANLRGKHYRLVNATCEPKPLQQKLPLLIGGGGERKTLRIVAKYADFWHGNVSDPAELAHKLEVLGKHCVDVGRDPGAITPLITQRPWLCIRDSQKDIDSWAAQVQKANNMEEPPELGAFTSADALVARLLEFWKAGARGFVFYTLSPFDTETLERIARDVRPRLEEAIAALP